jgi:DNA-binding NtrC family response regulator
MVLEGAGHRVIEASEYTKAQVLLSNGLDPDLLLIESAPSGTTEAEEYLRVLEGTPKHKICLILGMADQCARKQAFDLGIRHFLLKPATRRDLESLIDEMNHSYAQGAGNEFTSYSAETEALAGAIPGDLPAALHLEELGGGQFFLAVSPKMQEIYRQVKLLADVDVSVLVLGESGTGKEVIAHLIHKYSRRSREKFLKVNCAALPSDLLESELFGHRQGAFTGALRDRAGKFEQANRGTLLLDEIGEISVQMQAKLLHVLQDGEYTRLGAEDFTKVDVRVLAATNIDMESALLQKTFREDLYFRLNTFTIQIPPLRERREEIPWLIEEMIRRTPSNARNRIDSGFCSRLMDAALLYDWRGNIRELRNFVTRTIILQDPDSAIRELETKIAASSAIAAPERTEVLESHCPELRSTVRDVKDRTELQLIQDALEMCGWNRRRAAQYLNISYRGLLYKIQQHHLTPRPIKSVSETMQKSYSAPGDAA